MNMFFAVSCCVVQAVSSAPKLDGVIEAREYGDPSARKSKPGCVSQQLRKTFAAITVSDLQASESWYKSHLGTKRLSSSRAPSGLAENVVVGNDYLFVELIHFTAKSESDTVTVPTRSVGLKKVGIWIAPESFDSIYGHLAGMKARFVGGIFGDSILRARTFIVKDNSGVLLQFFTQQ